MINDIANGGNWWLLLDLRRLPGRLSTEQAARVLGFQPYDLPALLRAGLLKPLGGGSRNSVKYYSPREVEQLSADRGWLDRATKAVVRRIKSASRLPRTAENAGRASHSRQMPLGRNTANHHPIHSKHPEAAASSSIQKVPIMAMRDKRDRLSEDANSVLYLAVSVPPSIKFLRFESVKLEERPTVLGICCISYISKGGQTMFFGNAKSYDQLEPRKPMDQTRPAEFNMSSLGCLVHEFSAKPGGDQQLDFLKLSKMLGKCLQERVEGVLDTRALEGIWGGRLPEGLAEKVRADAVRIREELMGRA